MLAIKFCNCLEATVDTVIIKTYAFDMVEMDDVQNLGSITAATLGAQYRSKREIYQ